MHLTTEPVRIYALIAGALTAIGTALVAVGQGGDPLVAVGTAIVAFGVVVGGGELARQHTYAPATVDTYLDAESVIQAAGRGEHDPAPDDVSDLGSWEPSTDDPDAR